MTHGRTGNYQKPPAADLDNRDEGNAGSISSMFRLGDDKRNTEVLTDGKRILSWKLGAGDVAMAPVAGWDVFDMVQEGDTGHLYLPASTRNAPSVLSGLEAWSGEKKAVVEKVGQYLGEVQSRFGLSDIGFSWNQVGITPDQTIFIAPPNTPPHATDEQTRAWEQGVVVELGLLLRDDTSNYELVDSFAYSLRQS